MDQASRELLTAALRKANLTEAQVAAGVAYFDTCAGIPVEVMEKAAGDLMAGGKAAVRVGPDGTVEHVDQASLMAEVTK